MQIANSREELAQITQQWSDEKLEWAFVPTMGALHQGHLTLVKEALKHYPRVIVSVFVNPTQFDRADDLDKYPRRPKEDAEMLRKAGAHALFLPSVEVMYPNGTNEDRMPDLAGLDTKYEGAARPGHFDGVVQIVRRLVQAVDPKAMFMGQKDAQQVAILKRAALQEFWSVEIQVVPTVREASGLAMSSRNGQLSPQGVDTAATISMVLAKAEKEWKAGGRPRTIEEKGKKTLLSAGFKPEYFDFIDSVTFEPLPDVPQSEQHVEKPLIVTVAWLEGVRLIDNWPLY